MIQLADIGAEIGTYIFSLFLFCLGIYSGYKFYKKLKDKKQDGEH